MSQVLIKEKVVNAEMEKHESITRLQLSNTESLHNSEHIEDDIHELQTNCFVLGYN